ncbi:hypothetical protein KP509_06G001100 [Ceratopteris richardii]|uniref:1-phosphatidylinositol 4-kinase n=1 Tax=Ceratopteris richardii TaxID=49495 RepID=A0A8T2UDR3_CERRI|nr:hypothetical protein KP509_06G001100 [Ceratopteris richardii]
MGFLSCRLDLQCSSVVSFFVGEGEYSQVPVTCFTLLLHRSSLSVGRLQLSCRSRSKDSQEIISPTSIQDLSMESSHLNSSASVACDTRLVLHALFYELNIYLDAYYGGQGSDGLHVLNPALRVPFHGYGGAIEIGCSHGMVSTPHRRSVSCDAITESPCLHGDEAAIISYKAVGLQSNGYIPRQFNISVDCESLVSFTEAKNLALRQVFLDPDKNPVCLKISEHVRAMIEQVRMGLHAGCCPELTPEGTGGVYFMKNENKSENVAVFKPMDEEPMAINNPKGYTSPIPGSEGLRKGTRAGEGAIREVAAYLLDHPIRGHRSSTGKEIEEGFAGVPLTVFARCCHEAFTYSGTHSEEGLRVKLGSLQQFIPAFASCEEMGTSFFSVDEVHKITVLDLRLANTDRHAGNILIRRGEDGVLKLVPVDHGYCLPEKFGDGVFEWLYWPQASQPYGASTLNYIEKLDVEHDLKLLQECGWDMQSGSVLVLRITTMLLKKAAPAGLTPFQIGSILSCTNSMGSKPPIEAFLEQAGARGCCSATDPQVLDHLASLIDDYVASVKNRSHCAE